MFDAVGMEAGAGRRVAWMTTSLGLQLSVAGAVVVAAWMAPVRLPEVPEIHPPELMEPQARAVKLVRATAAAMSEAMLAEPVRRVFRAPQRVSALSGDTPAASLQDVMGEVGVMPAFVGSGLPPGGGLVVGKVPEIAPPPAVAKEPVVRERLRVGGEVMQARLLRQVRPEYPELARRARIEGEVLLLGVITREGRVAQLRVIGGHPLLVRAALEAVGQWQYQPTLLNGEAVEVEAPISVRFRLGR